MDGRIDAKHNHSTYIIWWLKMQLTYGIVKMFCSVCAVVSPDSQNSVLCQSSPTEPYPQEKIFLEGSKVIWKENDLMTQI